MSNDIYSRILSEGIKAIRQKLKAEGLDDPKLFVALDVETSLDDVPGAPVLCLTNASAKGIANIGMALARVSMEKMAQEGIELPKGAKEIAERYDNFGMIKDKEMH